MFNLPCPACGGQITFKSKASVFAVCPYCKSTAVRHDMNLETYGSMAEVQLDQSPLQIGTRGRVEGKSFELVGRLRVQWKNGFWNEWYALFDDGREGWLAEAQGFYAMSFPVEDVSMVPPLDSICIGQAYQLQPNGVYFEAEDVKEATCVGSEGELPLSAPAGRTATTVDFTAPGGQFASVEYGEYGGTRLFLGRYYDFDQYEFSYLREIDGW